MASTSKSVSRKELTLQQRVDVIKYSKSHPGVGSRAIAQLFSCGRTQIQKILNEKEAILTDFETNAPNSRKRCRGPAYADINDAMYQWFCLARERNIPVSGPMLKEEALMIAEKLGNHSFKASNGWLDSFKKRHNIKQLVVSGESADVSEETVDAWRERMKDLLEGYSPEGLCLFRLILFSLILFCLIKIQKSCFV